MLARKIQESAREIVYRTRGYTGGPITRLVSPSDLGELIKPFVFLDHFAFEGRSEPMPMENGWVRTGTFSTCRVGRPPGSATATRSSAISGRVVSGRACRLTATVETPSASVSGNSSGSVRAATSSSTSPKR